MGFFDHNNATLVSVKGEFIDQFSDYQLFK